MLTAKKILIFDKYQPHMSNIREFNFKSFDWIDITNPQKNQLVEIGEENNIDHLQVLDSLEHGHLPKFEKLSEYNFIILRAYTGKKNEKKSTVSELSNKVAFFYNSHKIITVHKAEFGFLDNLEIEYRSVSHLLVHIINEMIQTFVEPSEWHSDKIDQVEKSIFLKSKARISIEELYFQKSQTRIIKKLMQISQEVVSKITVDQKTETLLQDVKDKILRLILIYDEAVEDTNNLMNTYLALTASKSNDVMKLLTIFSAFFLPLTFIAGVYGMNFHYMPELHWRHGYYYVIILMAAVAMLIFYWFKRKKII